MVTIYFIRHGQSEANLQGIIQGHAEFPLSDLGKKQASLVGQWMANVQLDEIFSSDLQRAMITAEEIGQYQSVSVKPWDIVREVGLGPLEGKTRKQMYEEFPTLKPHALLTSGINGTESIDAVTTRCAYLVKQLTTDYDNKTVAVISHGGFIGIMLMYLIGGDEWHMLKRPFVIGNTGITKVELDDEGNAKLHYTNRMDHLRDDSKSSAVLY
ncbi:histidine phosphatase family protein [Salipaludibacillus daqingensis]|uniref:histidine phosphatase family protein n=1 Tax=Salipaludibacillus daqingensis TaxID=3041001 RepID=UPI002475AA5B|nr:histidine phosphatase family protein [Salipaludibacillus daqingensis]